MFNMKLKLLTVITLLFAFAATSYAGVGASISFSTTNVLCNGGNSGAIDLTVAGGSGNFSYEWSNGPTTEDISLITAGTYCVTVTDNVSSQTVSSCATINEPTAITVTAALDDPNCNGDSTGKISLTVSGGNPGYGFHWSNNANTEDLTGLAPGEYIVTVTDQNICAYRDTFTLNEPAALSVALAPQNITCAGTADGRINTTVTGGTNPYFYNWSNNASTANINNLTAGTYSVTVYDTQGCSDADTATITEPLAITATGLATNLQCATNPNGSIDLTVTNGTGAVSYQWSDSPTAATQDRASLKKGNYNVTVTDGNGCTATAAFTITSPDTIVITAVVTDASVFGATDGAIDLTVTGGVTPYLYGWSTGAQTQDISGLAANCYSTTVSDNNGCTQLVTNCVDQPADTTIGILDVANNITFSVFPNPANNTLNINVKGNNEEMQIAIYNMVGQQVSLYTTTATSNSTITTLDVTALPKGAYIVAVTSGNKRGHVLMEKL
jgi:hypothetical protein